MIGSMRFAGWVGIRSVGWVGIQSSMNAPTAPPISLGTLKRTDPAEARVERDSGGSPRAGKLVFGESFSRRQASYLVSILRSTGTGGLIMMTIVYLVVAAVLICGCLFIVRARSRD
jgi:hypothetical protein